eukprot:SAG31_NODE_23375_length_505_cov_2.305419_1_plen_40_part_01
MDPNAIVEKFLAFSEFVRSAFPPLVVKSLQRLCWFRVWIS